LSRTREKTLHFGEFGKVDVRVVVGIEQGLTGSQLDGAWTGEVALEYSVIG